MSGIYSMVNFSLSYRGFDDSSFDPVENRFLKCHFSLLIMEVLFFQTLYA